MSYIWFNTVLEYAGKVLNFESVSNMQGKTVLDKKSGKEIQKVIAEANPLYKKARGGNAAQTLMAMPGSMKIIDASNEKAQKKQSEDFLGDMSWIEEML